MKALKKVLPALTDLHYAFRPIKLSEQSKYIDLLAERFAYQSPLLQAFYKGNQGKISNRYGDRYQMQRNRWKMLYSYTKQYAIGCFDTQNGDLVGVSMASPLSFSPPEASQYMNDINYCSVLSHVKQQLLSSVNPQIQPIMKKKSRIFDIMAVAIKENHSGKGLFTKMMLSNEHLAYQHGFEYSYCFSVNAKTVAVAKKLGYQKISGMNADEFQLNGVRYFKEMDKAHNNATTLWIKKIRNTLDKEIV